MDETARTGQVIDMEALHPPVLIPPSFNYQSLAHRTHYVYWLEELTHGILDAISIRRRQGGSHEPSQREPILVELGKGSCISRSSFSFSSEAGGTFGCREPAAAAASALGPAEGMAAFGAGADQASAAAAGVAVASKTM